MRHSAALRSIQSRPVVDDKHFAKLKRVNKGALYTHGWHVICHTLLLRVACSTCVRFLIIYSLTTKWGSQPRCEKTIWGVCIFTICKRSLCLGCWAGEKWDSSNPLSPYRKKNRNKRNGWLYTNAKFDIGINMCCYCCRIWLIYSNGWLLIFTISLFQLYIYIRLSYDGCASALCFAVNSLPVDFVCRWCVTGGLHACRLNINRMNQ